MQLLHFNFELRYYLLLFLKFYYSCLHFRIQNHVLLYYVFVILGFSFQIFMQMYIFLLIFFIFLPSLVELLLRHEKLSLQRALLTDKALLVIIAKY
jgi:hypothetical protein